MSRKHAAQSRRERSKLAQEQFDADLAWLMADPRGRRFMWWLLELGHPFQCSFRTSAEMPFLEGERNLALKVMAQVRRVCHPHYLDMEREAMQAAQDAARVDAAITENPDDE